MRDNDGRKLDHKTLEALRIRAVDQVGEGADPEDVAAALGLHRKTVYGWSGEIPVGRNSTYWKAQPVPGPASAMSGQQLSRLYALIAGQDPRQMQFEFALWTREMIREVIRREFGVALSVVSVGRLLRKLGDVAAAAPPPRLSADRGRRAMEERYLSCDPGRRGRGGRHHLLR